MKSEQKKAPLEASCENCMYFDYPDDEESDKECVLNMDQDDMSHLFSGAAQRCPYFRFWDEYKFVQKQN